MALWTSFFAPGSDLMTESKRDKKALYGTKPVYKSPEESAATAISANLANLPKAQELGTKVNTYNQAELMAMLRRAIPGFDERTKLSGDVLTSRLKGEFTDSELDELQLAAASRGVGRGTGGGSDFDKKDLARRLGLNRYEETQRALDSNARWNESMARLTQPALFNIGSAFVPFEAQSGFDKLVADTKAAPDPAERGDFDSRMALFGMLLGAYGGGAGYQGAYRPASQGGNTQQYMQPNWTGGTSGNYLAESSPGFGSGGIYE